MINCGSLHLWHSAFRPRCHFFSSRPGFSSGRAKLGFFPWKNTGSGSCCQGGFAIRRLSIRASATASSVSDSGAEYSERMLDERRRQRRKSVAGIEQDELVDPKLLADPDSCFCEFKGVEIHHKIYSAGSQEREPVGSEAVSQLPNQNKKIGLPMILLHGFGASVFSWNRVMKPLAEICGSKVLAFDRPAFGLTSRVTSFLHLSSSSEDTKPLHPYSMAFSVLATLYFIDLLAAEKALLVGHSAGSLVAVNTYFEAPQRISALILVAPAILAPRKLQKDGDGDRLDKNVTTEGDSSKNLRIPFIQIFKTFSKFASYIMSTVMGMVKRMANMLNSLYKKALSAILRSAVSVMLVRMIIDKFGVAAVRNAWYDSKQVTDHVLQGYTKPLRTKDWDRALLEYTAAMLTDNESEAKPPLAKRLREIKCPVLIVTGDSDRLVPAWNSERLSQAIPGSSFQVIKNCGHLPHEEKVEEFVSVVEQFLLRVFGKSEEPYLQAVH